MHRRDAPKAHADQRSPRRSAIRWGGLLGLILALWGVGGCCDIPSAATIEFEYQASEGKEWILVSGVPKGVEAGVSVDSRAPERLPEDGIVPLPAGLSGEVWIAVGWSDRGFIRTSGRATQAIDLDEERRRWGAGRGFGDR